MRPGAMQHGEDAVPNDHVTKTGKLRDKNQLNSPSRVCLAAPKAKVGSRKEGYIHQGEKSKSLTFTKVRIPIGYTCLYSDHNLCWELKRKFNSKVE